MNSNQFEHYTQQYQLVKMPKFVYALIQIVIVDFLLTVYYTKHFLDLLLKQLAIHCVQHQQMKINRDQQQQHEIYK